MERLISDKVQKKGPWTPEEDQKLLTYIQQHGHGTCSWRTLPSKAGLDRCGKSCRLRWRNYLSPDIKRGNFSLHEQQTIIQLHALLGNRWSTIATHLPKRTDNEIKNYWNTHLKKRLTQMGIDPTTHKPKNHALGCTQAKDFVNLCHMAQWESARLEAESRLVNKSKLVSNPYNLLNKATTISATAPPPCLDILKVWRRTNPGKDISIFMNFNENYSSFRNIMSGGGVEMSGSGQPSHSYVDHEVKGIMGNSVQLHDVVINPINRHEEGTNIRTVDESLGFPSFMQISLTDFPVSATAEPWDINGGGCWGVLTDDNEVDYWNNTIVS